ncbi:MAG: hypothetical protein AAGI17_01915 [Planctomycetota bacterium]
MASVDTAGTWNEVRVSSSDPQVTKSPLDVSAREAWKSYTQGQGDFRITYEMARDPQRTDYQLIRDAFNNGTPIAFAELDGDKTTGEGWKADVIVTEFNESTDLGSARSTRFTIVPAGQNAAGTLSLPTHVTSGVESAS